MITQNSPSEKTEIAFLQAFKALKLAEHTVFDVLKFETIFLPA